MDEPKTEASIDVGTLEGLLDDLKDVHRRLGAQLRRLDSVPRLSGEYHDCLAEIYTLMTWLEGLAPDLQTEMDRLTDQLPDD
ncbi:MAG: hypothetical protein DMG27_15070 [Acidobacteria bacterium]|nr:MAG: hypothetical protein DMG27_15070 [Acidobacteriota bacterium]